MTSEQLGLKVAFYLYPTLLIVTLLGVQSLQFYRDRRRARSGDAAPKPEPRQDAKTIQKTFNRPIWVLQLVLCVLLIASNVIVTEKAVADDDGWGGKADFPFSAYLASYVGVALYFLAGLLPDPEGPWTPGWAHHWAWVTGAMIELVIASVFASEHTLLRLPSHTLHTLNVLALIRILILATMSALLGSRKFKLRPLVTKSLPEERQSLLENGNGSAEHYGSVPKPKTEKRRTQVAGTGWLEYFAGFRVLFPYLWPKDSHLYQAIARERVANPQRSWRDQSHRPGLHRRWTRVVPPAAVIKQRLQVGRSVQEDCP